jgi:hypothetical protein
MDVVDLDKVFIAHANIASVSLLKRLVVVFGLSFILIVFLLGKVTINAAFLSIRLNVFWELTESSTPSALDFI